MIQFSHYIFCFKAKENVRTMIGHLLKNFGKKPGLHVKKLKGINCYSANINDEQRILFTIGTLEDIRYCLVLDYLPHHEYEKSVPHLLEKFPVLKEKSMRTPSDLLAELFENDPTLRDRAITLDEEIQHPVFPNIHPETDNHSQRLILLTKTQREVLEDLQNPNLQYLVINGAAGSGKTMLAVYTLLKQLQCLTKSADTVSRFCYVGPTPQLVQNVKDTLVRLCTAHTVQEHLSQIDFLTYQELMPPIAAEKRWVTPEILLAWINQQPEMTTQKQNVEMLAWQICHELHMLSWCGYDATLYYSLGALSSYFSKEDKKINRKVIFELHQRFKQHCTMNNLVMLAEIDYPEPQENYQLIILDEMQYFGTRCFTNLNKLLVVGTGKLVAMGDLNQDHTGLFRMTHFPQLPFGRSFESPSIMQLEYNIRCDGAIAKIGEALYASIRCLLQGGQFDREEPYVFSSSGESTGLVRWVDSENFKLPVGNMTPILVRTDEDYTKLSSQFPTTPIFTLKQTGGLEFRSVILYGLFDNRVKDYQTLLKKALDTLPPVEPTHHKPPNKELAQQQLHFVVYLRSLLFGFTRAMHEVTVVDTLNSAMVKHIRSQMVGPQVTALQPTHFDQQKNRKDCYEELVLWLHQGDVLEQAHLQIKNLFPQMHQPIFELFKDFPGFAKLEIFKLLENCRSDFQLNAVIVALRALAQGKSDILSNFEEHNFFDIPPDLQYEKGEHFLHLAMKANLICYIRQLATNHSLSLSLSLLRISINLEEVLSLQPAFPCLLEIIRIFPALLRDEQKQGISSFQRVEIQYHEFQLTIQLASLYLQKELEQKKSDAGPILASILLSLDTNVLAELLKQDHIKKKLCEFAFSHKKDIKIFEAIFSCLVQVGVIDNIHIKQLIALKDKIELYSDSFLNLVFALNPTWLDMFFENPIDNKHVIACVLIGYVKSPHISQAEWIDLPENVTHYLQLRNRKVSLGMLCFAIKNILNNLNSDGTEKEFSTCIETLANDRHKVALKQIREIFHAPPGILLQHELLYIKSFLNMMTPEYWYEGLSKKEVHSPSLFHLLWYFFPFNEGNQLFYKVVDQIIKQHIQEKHWGKLGKLILGGQEEIITPLFMLTSIFTQLTTIAESQRLIVAQSAVEQLQAYMLQCPAQTWLIGNQANKPIHEMVRNVFSYPLTEEMNLEIFKKMPNAVWSLTGEAGTDTLFLMLNLLVSAADHKVIPWRVVEYVVSQSEATSWRNKIPLCFLIKSTDTIPITRDNYLYIFFIIEQAVEKTQFLTSSDRILEKQNHLSASQLSKLLVCFDKIIKLINSPNNIGFFDRNRAISSIKLFQLLSKIIHITEPSVWLISSNQPALLSKLLTDLPSQWLVDERILSFVLRPLIKNATRQDVNCIVNILLESPLTPMHILLFLVETYDLRAYPIQNVCGVLDDSTIDAIRRSEKYDDIVVSAKPFLHGSVKKDQLIKALSIEMDLQQARMYV